MITTEQQEYLLPEAFNAAVRAGAAILDIYERTADYDVTLKSDNTPITLADRRAHETIRTYLAPTRVPLLSEEGREMLYDERRGWDLFWMVDPLDGTKEFIKGNGEFTVNIALLADNKPVLSVIYVPYLSKIYFSCKGMGAFLIENIKACHEGRYSLDRMIPEGIRLPLSNGANTPLRIAVSRSHNTDETFRFVELIMRQYPGSELVYQGSSYKFGLLAEGGVDCYVRTTSTYEWDTAAGQLIMEEAGGRMYAWPDQQEMEYNKLSLLNPGFICLGKFMPEIE